MWIRIILILALLGACGHAAAQEYMVALLPLPQNELPGEGVADDINDRGQIVGAIPVDRVGIQGGLWESHTAQPRDLGKGHATAINERGGVVGFYVTDDTPAPHPLHAWLWKNGTRVDLGRLLNGDSFATDINDQGQVVGVFHGADQVLHAFLWTPSTPNGTSGRMRVLGPGFAAAINNDGQVVGHRRDAQDVAQPVLWENNVPRIIDGLPGAVSGIATDINNRGQVVGVSFSATSQSAFLWESGATPVGLESTGGPAQSATGINDGGRVVGISRGTGFFVWENGEGRDLGMLGLPNIDSLGRINSRGDFVGVTRKGQFGFRFPFVARAGGGGIRGKVEYEKVPVTAAGLQLSQKERKPVVGVIVDLLRSSGREPIEPLATSGPTDEEGNYTLTPPAGVTGRVVLRVRAISDGVRVVLTNNTSKVYELRSSPFSLPAQGQSLTKDLLAADNTAQRVNGPFNILAAVRKGNALLESIDPGFEPAGGAVLWSARNRLRRVLAPLDSIMLRGDRNVDSDEFDDHVILALYGRLLLAAFSRDDNPYPFDAAEFDEYVDPRMAWSEGWGFFFAAAALQLAGDPDPHLYRDSRRSDTQTFDLEANRPGAEVGLIGASRAVASVLWDVFDSPADAGDPLALAFGPIWSILTGPLKGKTYIDLADFLLVLEEAGVATADQVQQLVLARGPFSIETAPLPTRIEPNTTVGGGVVSTELPVYSFLAREYYFFVLLEPNTVRIELEILPGGGRSNLDLVLLNETAVGESSLVASSRQLRGTRELITASLPVGAYVVVVDSLQGSAARPVRNVANYNLTVTSP